MSPNEFYIFDQRDLLKTHTNFEWATQVASDGPCAF
jgi:hypothetical protein